MNPYGNIVLLTGASSGIGNATAKLLAKEGFSVYGLSRRGEGRTEFTGGGFLQMLAADLTDEGSVNAAVSHVLDIEKRVDVLINCAGNGVCGPVEECGPEDALLQLDVNYLGVIRMLNAVLPGMRERRNGLVINIGSVGGIFAIPFQSLYSSSKFAIEALTECLRIELLPYGVRAALVEPGDIKTGFTGSRVYAGNARNSSYGDKFAAAIAQMEHDETHGMDPAEVAKVIYSVIKRKNPPVRVVVGFTYKLLVFLKRVLPSRLIEKILTLMYPNSKAGAKKK